MTFTLSPKICKVTAMCQYDSTICEIRTLLKKHLGPHTLVTELTEIGNVHYHAVGYIKDKFAKISLIDAFKKKRAFGFLKVTPQPLYNEEHLNRTLDYLIKELPETSKIVRRGCYIPEMLFIENCN